MFQIPWVRVSIANFVSAFMLDIFDCGPTRRSRRNDHFKKEGGEASTMSVCWYDTNTKLHFIHDTRNHRIDY